MIRRIRFLAALLALFAFSASLGESVWASMCPPGMEAHASLAEDRAELGAHAGMHHGSAPTSDDSDSSRSDAPGCPLGMAGAGNSCMAVWLPAATSTMTNGPRGYTAPTLFLDSTHDRLLLALHFRPPRA